MSTDIYRCPKCSRRGNWRHGVGFEHEMICYSCWLEWCPAERQERLQELIDSQLNVDGGGI